ncbi:tyrosyl-DNA phosphodiesterase 2 [Python bivittatus]|uniref:Tyrosyl-DNA phosphodiesterase 2 n=1 Tax=Python bivittatus TaxID=176946 RepID=A0A9F2QVX4_PYTBI|nr:tyrosyl-DNA phosphodiesterase 2 [Python bivittatus]
MEGDRAAQEVERTPSEAKEQQRGQSAEEGGQWEELEKYRKRLCSEFASISSSDTAVAERYLAENGWDMQKALNSFFDPPREQDALRTPQQVPTTGALVELTDDSATNTVAAVVESAGVCPQDDSTFSLITWNIDGLDSNNLQERARGVCSYIALYSPDVVFLQEVIPPYFSYLQKRAVSYTIIPGNMDNYFTAIMLKKSRVKVLKHEITAFPTTSMLRNLLAVYVTISGNDLCLMTSHLESTKDHSEERLKQLRLVLAKMAEVPESSTVIFGGDTNLRDKEVAKIGGLPNNILDIWEFLGKPEHCHYTWDTSQNTNLNVRYKCKTRFDRLFMRGATTGGQIIPQSLDLIGLEKLDCGRFPSDHWGLLCNFDVVL